MATLGLGFVDWLIIVVYFAFIIWLGFYLKRFTRTQEDFFLAGRKNSALNTVCSFNRKTHRRKEIWLQAKTL